MRLITLACVLSAFVLVGCADRYDPLIDLKASENPELAQEDTIMCEMLIKRFTGEKDKDWLSKDPDTEMLRKCLIGRGHSVLN